jgi:diguanylate cyclase (GGDEF)-like protein
VEDNPGDARLVRILLSEAGPSAVFEVTHVARLGEAISRIEGAEFDVVLLDLSLPDANGLETVGRIRDAAPHLPVVVLSGLSDEEVAVQAIQVGAEDYLVKGQGGGDLIARSIRYAIERKKAEDHLSYLSNFDSLTQLANRVLFQDRLEQALARADRNGSLVALLFVDLDRFKAFNDALGNDFGDMLLKTVAARIRGCAREGDTVARMGSDEFCVILEDISESQEAVPLARNILEALGHPFSLFGQEVFVGASMGIAVRRPHQGGDAVKDAVAAAQRAKEVGPGGYQFFTPEMNVRAFERLAFESNLRRAFERGELTLHYQPQVDLKSGRIVGAEALMRWHHPNLGLVPPDKFVPVLEEIGLMVPAGEWVIRAACEQARVWQEEGVPVRVAVNLSAQQFRRHDLTSSISHALDATGLDPSCLELEITESILMERAETSGVRLEELKTDKGVQVSIDDFGTGYSSLAYLKRFPLDVLKIDRSFVRDIAEDPDAATIVSAIIGLAHNLRLKVIAEGVETAEQLAYLQDQDCDLVQGFLFSRPIPADAFTRLLREGGSVTGIRPTG